MRKSLLGRDQDTKRLLRPITFGRTTVRINPGTGTTCRGVTDPFERQGRIEAYGNLQNLSGFMKIFLESARGLSEYGAQGYQTEMSLRQQALQRLMGKAEEWLGAGFATDYRGRQQALGDERDNVSNNSMKSGNFSVNELWPAKVEVGVEVIADLKTAF